jgi:hypothetical protein
MSEPGGVMPTQQQIVQDCIDASNAVYLRPVTPPDGWILLPISGGSNDLDGFYSQAYEDTSNGLVIIAYEGTYTNTLDYAFGTAAADALIAGGLPPSCLSDAVRFARQVRTFVGANTPIYVTGHSLGGTEAEQVALTLGSSIAGGVTFGATGLPGYSGPSNQQNFVDYVDYGDPVGNYASDSSSELNGISLTGNHFGSVVQVGNSFDAFYLKSAEVVAEFSPIDSLPGFLALLAAGTLIGIDHQPPHYWQDMVDLGLGYRLPTSQQANSTPNPNLALIFSHQPAQVATNLNPHPIITGKPAISAVTNSFFTLSSLFSGSEVPSTATHHIDHYSLINTLEGPGQFVVDNQLWSGNVLNVSPAELATAFYSAGPNPGVNEIAVVAFDDAGQASNEFAVRIAVTTPSSAPQPVNPNDHTPPTIVSPSQQLVTNVGSSPSLTSIFLNVTDSNSANYIPSQLLYTVTTSPSHGYLLKGGSIVNSFTQADINDGLLQYQENGTVAANDSFSYFVSDPAGNRTSNVTFNIGINAPPTSTHPILDTNSALSVGQGQTALITDNNLHVTDNGVQPWQIIYTVTGGAGNGQILADGINPVQWFTQQQVDLGLVSYRNTGNVSGPDNMTFAMSDGTGGTIGQTTFGISVIPKNNLQVTVDRPLFQDPGAGDFPTSGSTTPADASLIGSDILSGVDPGVDPANITFTVLSMPANSGFFIGQWGPLTDPSNWFSGFSGIHFDQADLIPGAPHSFTLAQINAGHVFFRQPNNGVIHPGAPFSITLSASDNAGNSLPNINLPGITYGDGLLTAGTFYIYGSSIPDIDISAPIGGATTIGSGKLTFLSPQFSDSQTTWWVWYLPQHGSLLLNGIPLAAHSTFTQADIDQGRFSFVEDGSAITSDNFGLGATDPNNPGNFQSIFRVDVAMTGTNGGQVLTGEAGAETLPAGVGNNYFLGDGNTTVDYSNSPNGVSANLASGSVGNGYGGTDTLTNIHSVIGSRYDDRLIGSPGNDTFVGGGGNDTIDGGLGLDTVIFSGNGASSTVTRTGGIVTVNGSNSTDTLIHIERLQFADVTMTIGPPPSGDFYGDGISDQLMINNSGALVIDQVIAGGMTYQQIGGLGSEWQFEGSGYFSGPGSSEFLIWNDNNGALVLGNVLGGQANYQAIGGVGSEWQFIGNGNFLNNGNTDFLMWNSNTGAIVAGADVGGTAQYTQVGGVGSEWQFHGTGDFIGDGNNDFLMRNSLNGALVLGEINPNTNTTAYTVIGGVGTEWQFEGVGDFLGNGRTDFLMRNSNNGALVVGDTNGGVATYAQIGGVGSEWKFVGTGDYFGSGHADFMMRNSLNGALVVGAATGNQVQYTAVGGVGPEWTLHN